MSQLLLVDDEASVVDALAMRIAWNGMGIEQLHKAYSSYEAMAIMNEHAIDIAIMDISMPGMNGIELLQWIRKSGRRTKCIMLSGHADFEYAKQSLDHAAVHYLLKPASDAELMDVVSGQLAALQEEWRVISSHHNAIQALQSHLPLLRNHFLNELLQGRKLPEGELAERLRLLKLPFREGESVAALLILIEDGFTAYDSQSIALFEYAIGNMAEEIFQHRLDAWIGKDVLGYLILLVKPRTGEWKDEHAQETRRCATELQANVKKYLKGAISIIVSDTDRFPALKRSYDLALLEMRRSIGNDQEFLYSAPPHAAVQESFALQSLYEPPLLQHLLEAGRWEAAREKIDSVMAELHELWSDSQEHLLEVYSSFQAAFAYLAHRNGKRLVDIAGQGYYLRMAEGNPSTFLHRLSEWAALILERLREDMERGTTDSRTAIVKKVQLYIETHLAEDVSLQAMADHVYLNPGYLSKVYKMMTGENISDYLHRLRMERSAHMLKHTNDKVYHIATQVGYQNAPYFIKVFKKHYGITPQEYRERQ